MLVVHGRLGLGYAGSTSTSSASSSSSWSLRSPHAQRDSGHSRLRVRHHRCSLPCIWAFVYGMFVMNLGLQFCISMFAVGFAVGRFRNLLASSLCSTRWSQQQPLGPFATVRTCPPCQPSSHGWQGGMDEGSYGTLWAQPLGGLTPQTRR